MIATRVPSSVTLLPGHGDRAGRELLDWQREYIERFVGAVRSADWSDQEAARGSVVDSMASFLERDDLRFLMQLSIDPVAAKLGVGSFR